MEPALDVIHRSLGGELEARKFLETTFSTYALDVTDVANPKTYGGWNFIHQAMNEIERYESLYCRHRQNNSGVQGEDLSGHARLLASMALGLARRPPKADHALVDKCVRESSGIPVSAEQSKWLKDVNFELREIVMGRIAATAFDFSFHRRSSGSVKSAFADRVVVDSFCAILSANAVSNGPNAIRHFSTEWIIPSSKSLPPFALGAVVLHLADEGVKICAPAGTKDMLQQLSVLVMSVTLGPILAESVTGNISNAGAASYGDISHVCAICLRAIDAWCKATDLSLPQIRHICQKVNVSGNNKILNFIEFTVNGKLTVHYLNEQIDLVSLLSDAMYSDSHNAIDALSQLLESNVQVSNDDVVSMGRMKQLRLILEQDEATFSSRFGASQLKVIETKEIALIVDELVTATGLQRFRFTERQNSGDHDVCRNLTRIATTVVEAWLNDSSRQIDSGLLALLLKASAHPSVNICGIALQSLSKLLGPMPAISTDVLRILQRRAIISYHQKADGTVSLAASDVCGVHFQEFLRFRATVLTEALLECWKADGVGYMNSCITAIEEFCAAPARIDVSLGLEAALFCIEVVASDSLDSKAPYAYTPHLKRCFNALSLKPPSLATSQLSLSRACSLVKKYSRWFKEVNNIRGAADLVLSVYSLAAAACVTKCPRNHVERESCASPMSEAALALEEILSKSSCDLGVDGALLSSLLNGWTVSYAVQQQDDYMTLEARVALATGICYAIASLPEDESKVQSFQRLVVPTTEHLSLLAKSSAAQSLSKGGSDVDHSIFSKLADELTVLSSLLLAYGNATSASGRNMESGCSTSSRSRPKMSSVVLALVQQTWGAIGTIAQPCSKYEPVAASLARYLASLLPSTFNEESNLNALSSAFDMANIMSDVGPVSSVCLFLGEVVQLYGGVLQNSVKTEDTDARNPIELRTRALIVRMINSCESDLGESWTSGSKQGQGQAAKEHDDSAVKTSNNELETVLCFLCKTLDACPSFALKLASGSSRTNSDIQEFFISRAMQAAVFSLSFSDASLVSTAITYILSMCRLTKCGISDVCTVASDIVAHHRSNVIHLVLKSCCGECEGRVLEEAASLLYVLVGLGDVEQTQRFLVSSLQQDYFLMGDECKTLMLAVLASCSKKTTNIASFRKFLEQVWHIHRAKDPEFLPSSDTVRQFLDRFGRETRIAGYNRSISALPFDESNESSSVSLILLDSSKTDFEEGGSVTTSAHEKHSLFFLLNTLDKDVFYAHPPALYETLHSHGGPSILPTLKEKFPDIDEPEFSNAFKSAISHRQLRDGSCLGGGAIYRFPHRDFSTKWIMIMSRPELVPIKAPKDQVAAAQLGLKSFWPHESDSPATVTSPSVRARPDTFSVSVGGRKYRKMEDFATKTATTETATNTVNLAVTIGGCKYRKIEDFATKTTTTGTATRLCPCKCCATSGCGILVLMGQECVSIA